MNASPQTQTTLKIFEFLRRNWPLDQPAQNPLVLFHDIYQMALA